MDLSDHPELDMTDICNIGETKIYWYMIGEIQWEVTLGIFDIIFDTFSFSIFRSSTRTGHLEKLKRI